MAAELSDQLTAYLANRAALRADRVRDFLAELTEYERGLVHDAAVMGFVRGSLYPRGEEIPLNQPIIDEVIDACFVYPELYPTVNADFEDRRTTVEYFVQCQQPDGSWEQCSSNSPDAAYIVRQRDAHRRKRPEFVYRIARRTTRVIVQAEITPESQ